LHFFIAFFPVALDGLARSHNKNAPFVQIEDESAESEHDLELIDSENKIDSSPCI
jgi:hypothetical protein